MNRIITIYWLTFLLTVSAYTNTPVQFTHYSTFNGLPNDFVLSIVQDNNDFIWFGTHLGVVRFDGYRYKLYQPDPNNNNSLSHKHVGSMYADLRGNLWIRYTEYALNRLEINTGKIFNYSSDNSSKGNISSLQTNCFFEDEDSVLWIGTHSGLNKYNPHNDSFTSILPGYLSSKTRPTNHITGITDDNSGNLWFLSLAGIGCIRKSDFKLTSLGQMANKPELDNYRITSMVCDRKTKLWFTTWKQGVFCYDIVTGSLSEYLTEVNEFLSIYIDKQENIHLFSGEENTIYTIRLDKFSKPQISSYNAFETKENVRFLRMAEDNSGNIWISSSQGLDMLNPKDGITHYKNKELHEQSLSSNTINYLFIDNTNNLWVSNYRSGVDKADLNQKPFKKQFTNPKQTNNIFLGTNITAIIADNKDNLWVGATGKSILKIDKKTGTKTPVRIFEDDQSSFSALFEDSKGDIWVGNYDSGIKRIDPKTLKITYSNHISEWEEHKEQFWSVRKFVEDENGDIWFTSARGIHKWVRSTEKVIPYSYLYDPHDLDQGFYRTVFIDNKGTLWSGSYNGGMARYNTHTNKIKRYVHIPGDNTSISGNGVYVIYEESDSTFLVGTTFGLNRFHKNTEQFSLLNTKTSLHNYSIYTIIPDSLNNYWLATDNGLIQLNKNTLECVFYNQGDGLPANEFNTTANCLCNMGDIYLGSPRGLLSFNPNDFTKNPFKANPTITNLQINNIDIAPGDTLNGRVLLSKQIWKTEQIDLKYFENDFAFQFSAMHYAVPKNNKFWYMLQGYKDEWFPVEENRISTSFTGLPPGKYIFKLKATNNDGTMCLPKDRAIININIHPPFWKTTWFKGTSIILLIFLIVFTFKLRVKRIKSVNTLLENKVDERTKELRNANNSLREHKEELITQKESLENTNISLRETQKKVISQNKELDLHKNELATLVKERTTELLKALEKAKESDRLKSSFLANMSHEIRTPMNAIIGFASLLQDREMNEENRVSFVRTIIKNGESLLVLINDILDISRIESGQLIFNYQTLSLHEILKDTFDVFNIENANKDVEVKLNTENVSSELTVFADEVRLKQVLSNLISNALKFTNCGFVEFGVKEVSDNITFYIKDTGIGIPQNTGDKIFKRFAKIEDDPDNLYRGVGLGLAISKSLVELWDGNLWYESVKKVGSTFYFTVPNKNINQKIEVQYPIIEEEKLDVSNVNILVAEDEDSNYELLFQYFKLINGKLSRAKNGKEACEMVNANPYDIILMDIKMPVMTGIEAAKIIKEQHPMIKIIAQSAFTSTDHKDLINNGIFDSFIAKPIKSTELFSILAKYI